MQVAIERIVLEVVVEPGSAYKRRYFISIIVFRVSARLSIADATKKSQTVDKLESTYRVRDKSKPLGFVYGTILISELTELVTRNVPEKLSKLAPQCRVICFMILLILEVNENSCKFCTAAANTHTSRIISLSIALKESFKASHISVIPIIGSI